MNCEKTGELIKKLRKNKNMTQSELAAAVFVSDKAVSKWERGCGCPDISLLADLAATLGVNVDILLGGQPDENERIQGNMKNVKYYYCKDCGNLITATGNAEIFCCSKKLTELEKHKADESHLVNIENVEDDWFVTSSHPMTKDHYITFLAFATGDKLQIFKQYPEWELQLRLPKRGHGTLLWLCSQDGLFYKYI